MQKWRKQKLDEAIRHGLLSQDEADELDARSLDDDAFLRAIMEARRRTDRELAELEGLLGPALRGTASSAWSADGRPHMRQETTAPDLSELSDVYEIRGRLAEGGMGWVFEAFDPQLHRRVAIKVAKEARDASACAATDERGIRQKQGGMSASAAREGTISPHAQAATGRAESH